MKTYSEFIEPGLPLRLALGGRILYVQRSEAGPVLSIKLKQGGNVQGVERVGSAFKAEPVGGFDGIEIAATVAGVVDFVITDGDVGMPADAIRVDSAPADPIYVSFTQQIVPLGSVTVNNPNAAAAYVQQQALSVIVDHAQAVINTGAAQLLINDATYKRLRVRNASATARVALGGAAVTMANAAIILEPGDMWPEDDAAGAAWYAVSDIAGADVRVMGVK